MNIQTPGIATLKVANILTSFLATKIIIKYMGIGGFGRYEVFSSFVELSYLVFGLGLEKLVVKNSNETYIYYGRYISGVIKYCVIQIPKFLLAVLLLIILFVYNFDLSLPIWLSFSIIVFTLVAISSLLILRVFEAIILSDSKPFKSKLNSQLVRPIIFITAILICSKINVSTLEALVMANSIATLIAAFFAYLLIRNKIHWKSVAKSNSISFKEWKENFILGYNNFLQSSVFFIDALILNTILSAEALGAYRLCVKFMLANNIFLSSSSSLVSLNFKSFLVDNNLLLLRSNNKKELRTALILSLPLGLLMLFAPTYLLSLFNIENQTYALTMRMAGCWTLINAALGLPSITLIMLGKQILLCKIFTCHVFMFFALLIILTPIYGINFCFATHIIYIVSLKITLAIHGKKILLKRSNY